ncbi:ankyrin repeat domain-containing protein 36C isoform X3 [Cheilinus undulatus]|uniref:ankyrin repeat domain-containing protein 36C isoform X3 n=1 Tax=Cheilinus undulatus TaxID=241271 RepID=UPI001BD4030D|nr:ankyrin repeat domain-containing protein 36C isoform X3 [Cheilinus undulatus]
MKKIFSFTKKKKHPSGTPDSGSVLSVGYELKDKDLGKVHKAASVGDLAKLKQLAKKNDINQLDKENRTALHIACASGHVEVVQYLVESKAKLNLCDNQNRSALMKAVQGQHERCMSILLENHAEPNLVDINGNTALHLAANIPSISTAVLLLEHEAAINAQNKEGFAPLSVAVREDHIEMAEFLLKEGADVNLIGQDQRTPLMIAAGNGQIGMLRLLLRYDADITLKDAKGWSADDYAVMNGHHPCSLLIIEHSTQRNDGPSISAQGPSKKKKKTLLGSPSQDIEAGFSLGGPATDKDDFEDNSQSESLSRVSKSAADEWPSTDDDDESVLVEKKPQKVNLRRLIASEREGASALPDRSLSGTESEPESENRVQRIPSLPQALPSSKAPQHPVDPSPVSFLSKTPQMTSTPLPSYRKKEESTEDEDEREHEMGDDDEEEEGDISDENQLEESGESLEATVPVPETESSTNKKRDFLSELGLEKEEEEPDSWDSESRSESPEKPHEGKQKLLSQDQEIMSPVKDGSNENFFYVPSFVRGRRDKMMADLEPWRSIGRQKGSQGEVANYKDDDNRGEEEGVDQDCTPQKETEKPKWEPLNVLSKIQGEKEQTDLMEELGLGDVDDLEDASDWDSASTTSKRTLPGRRMPSPGIEEFPECSNPPVKEEDEDVAPEAPLTPQRSINSKEIPQPGPHPQPRARKMVLQKPESEEESDWEPDNMASSSKINKVDSQSISELQVTVTPGSPEFLPMVSDRKNYGDSDHQQQKEKERSLDTPQLDLDSPSTPGYTGCDSEEKDYDCKNRHSPEESEKASEEIPWEKRYEKLWVEVEKREVKSTFKNVACELKEKFGELLKSRVPAEEIIEDEQGTADSSSSDEEEEETFVRPTARARSTVLLTIPEQRESGLEDSVTESPDRSACDDRMKVCERPASESSMYHEQDLLTDDAPEKSRSPSPRITTAPRNSFDNAPEVLSDGHNTPTSHVDHHKYLKEEAKLVRIQNTDLHHVSKDTSARCEEEHKNNTSPGEDPEEFPESHNPSLCKLSASFPGVSDEELEEDMERFKHEAVQETTKTTMDVQKSKTCLHTGEVALEEVVSTEKPESRLGSLSSQAGAIPQQQQSGANQSTSEAPVQLHLQLQQTHSSNKQEETQQLELVRGAQRSRAPQTNARINGDPLSVFDDSTLSDVSDDEGRLATSGQQKNENPEEVEMAEDFDELTQSSDTATEDVDSPTSGYRHASLLIQKLDSASFDSRSMVKLQNIFHEYERSIQKAKSRHGYLTDKVSQLEMEKVELKSSLEEIKDMKSALERNQLELQTEVTNVKFQLKQEQENRRNATMMYNTTKDKLRRTEEQHQIEVQERQKVELTLRNLELEMRTLVNNMKQLEEDHNETQRLLAQERSARTLQENLLNSHLRKQQEIEDENKRNISKSNEALSQLTEASDRERELVQQTATLQEQLTILRTELEHSQANSSLKESHLLEENETLKEQLEDARRDLKLNGEALTQTVFNCNNQVTALKSELAMTVTRFENERQSRETLETEVESTRSRLAGAVKEAELCLASHTDTERALLREKEEHQRLKDKLSGDATTHREAVSSLSQKLAKAEARANSMENEVHRVTLQLTEKGLLLDVLQREKDQAAAQIKELEKTLRAEKELVSRAGARQEATQERLVQAQSEGMLLRQQLEEAQNKGNAKDRAVTDAQERFSDILSKLRSDCEERVQLVEERNKELSSKAADLRDQIYKLEEEKSERETNLRQLQQELADSLKKLSMSEASLEVNTRYRSDLEEEKTRLLKDMDRLKGKLEESEDQYVQAERRINSLKSSLDEREKELCTAAQKLQEVLSTSAASDSTIKQLEEAVQRLEIENARLEAAAKQQSNKIDALQKGAQEAVRLSDCSPEGGVRTHLEDLVTNLQSSKMTLEDQLSREVQKQSMLSHTAQDSQALWEEELKSRSKLGLRLAELEKEKGELSTQMEIEKKKAKKIAEQKKAIDDRLDQEMKRNSDLQKEMYRLRTLLKTAKKKLRDQDTGGAEFGSPMSSLRLDQGRYSQAEGRMKEKVEDLQVQLEKEVSRRSQLERMNGELKDQLASMRSLSHSNDQQERSKRQLEEEVLELRRRMEAAQMEQSQMDQYRRDIEERARQEVTQKLEQVNLFLQSQAASQEALDQIKAANEANLRTQLEQKVRELEGELGRARTTHHDSLNQRDSTRTELERYRQLYAEELRLRKSLSAKLERANSRLAEANSKLLNERSRSLITSSIANGSLAGPSLDVGSLGSPAHYGTSLGPLNRSLGLGLSLLSPVTDGQNSRVEDYLAKMQSELDRSISKELNNATAELYVTSARMSTAGSVSRAELDPVSTATQQYLEVLKKNNMI